MINKTNSTPTANPSKRKPIVEPRQTKPKTYQWARSHLLKFHKEAVIITKTCLYNFDPLKPHFYIVKLGFTGVYIIFLFLLKNIDCGYSLEPPRRGGSNEYQQSMFWAEIWKKYQSFYLKIFSFWRWNFLYIWIGVFS